MYGGKDMTIEYRRYLHGDLAGILELCVLEGWPSFPADAARADRALTVLGVTTFVALSEGRVIGFAQLQSDGEIQAHVSLVTVDKAYRRRGIGRELIARALARARGERVDLVTDTAPEFYQALPHRRMQGFRIYPLLKQ
jgi:ribosomal protein S18 acetylase RimI-like enzyme